MGPGSFPDRPLSLDHSFSSAQPSPTLMPGSSPQVLQALAASPRLPTCVGLGVTLALCSFLHMGLRSRGGELEMITSAPTLGGLAHMGPRLTNEAPSLASAVFKVKWDRVLAQHRCSTIKACC